MVRLKKPMAAGTRTHSDVAIVIDLGTIDLETVDLETLDLEAIEPDAKPYPTVVLKDCPTPTPTWRMYDARTGKQLTMTLPPGTQPTPYLSTVEVIYYQGRWGVSKIAADTSRTCTA